MQQVSHIERVDSAPSTPTRGHGLESRSPATLSRKRFTFSTWTSPLKSLRSRRKFAVSTNQGPTVKKHNPSLFSFFYGTRTRSLGSTDALKDGVGPHRPKSASPVKNHLRGDEDIKYRPKRSKSFADLLGSISIRVSSKYNTVSGRNIKFDITDFNFQPQRVISGPDKGNLDLKSAPRNVDEYATLPLRAWQQRIRKIELEMSAFWELEEAIENFKRSQTTDLLGLIKDDASSYSTLEGSDKTLYNFEDELLDRGTPKYEDEKISCGITPSFQLDLLALSAKISVAASVAESSSRESGYDPASSHRPDAGAVDIPPPRFKNGINANDDSTIAERIQLTVDEMTKTRHMKTSTYSIERKSSNREAESDGCGPPPYIACTDSSSIAAVPRSTDSTLPLSIKLENTAAENHQSIRNTEILSFKLRAENKQTRLSPRKSRQASNAPVRVTFPDTSTGPGHVGIYDTRSEAISKLFEMNNGELSNVCAYDRGDRIIHAYRLGSAPNFSELLRRGYESIWLPLENRHKTEKLFDRVLSGGLLAPDFSQSRQTSTSSLQDGSSTDDPPPMTDTAWTKQSMMVQHDKSALSGKSKIQCSSPVSPRIPNRDYLEDDVKSNNESFSDYDGSNQSHFLWSFEEQSESIMEHAASSQSQGNHERSDLKPPYRKTNAKKVLTSCEIDEWRKIGPLKDYLRNTHSQWQYCLGQENTASGGHYNRELESKHLDESGVHFASCHMGEPMLSLRQDQPHFPSHLRKTDGVEPNLDLSLSNSFTFAAYAAELLETGGHHEPSERGYSHSSDGANSSTSSCHGLSSIYLTKRPSDQANTFPTPQDAPGIQASTISKVVRYTQPNFIDKLPDINEANESDDRKCYGTCSGTSLDLVAGTRSKVATGEHIRGQTIPCSFCKLSCTCVNQLLNPVISNEPKKVAGLVEIFQARRMIHPGLISAIQRTLKLSSSVDSCGEQTLPSSNNLVNKLTVNDTAGATSRPICCPLLDPDQRTTRSLATTPDSSLDDSITEMCPMGGEQLHRFEKFEQGSEGAAVQGKNEGFCEDSLYG